jgi:hydrogenase-4 component B
MPRTAACFLVGAVAICGLPPLNGFVSELLIYLGLFRSVGVGGSATFVWAGFALVGLALIGALALACFVKVYGAVFLGHARSSAVDETEDPGATMIGPMLLLAFGCILIGLAPVLVAPPLNSAIDAWMSGSQLDGEPFGAQIGSWAQLGQVSKAAAILLIALALGAAAAWMLTSRRVCAAAPTWGCGYAAPSARMQYTASSFAELLVDLFGWALQPKTRQPAELALFPKSAAFARDVPDVVLDGGVLPSFRWLAWVFNRLRVLHQGNIQAYLLYMLLTLAALLWL